jgi:phosphoglycolate phosphatase
MVAGGTHGKLGTQSSCSIHPRFIEPWWGNRMIELVAFDMAGTTIDDHGLVYDALADCVRETGATLDDADLQAWMGTDKLTAITALLALGGGDSSGAAAAFERFRVILRASYLATPPVALPGVADTLQSLRSLGVKVSLTTGFSDDVAYPILDAIGWSVGDLLDAVVTTSDVTSGRPAPYLIQHAMEKTGVEDVRGVLAAGDTIVDLLAAHNAGVIGVGVLTGALTRDELAQHPHRHIVDSVVDVLNLPEVTGHS